jgi:hypothetical protein
MRIKRTAGLLISLTMVGCSGRSDLTTDRSSDRSPMGAPNALVAVSGARRLTRTEYDNTVRDLLGDVTSSGFGMLPPDAYDPFDNDYRTQLPSPTLIEALEVLATNAAGRLVADPAKRSAILPCTPSGPADAACFRNFIVRFGRKALRRPLSNDEVQSLLGFQAFSVEGRDFFIGMQLAIRALLQHPEFIYRVEVGTPVDGSDGLYRLNNFEVATRLSYFLWGTTPPDWLLDLSEAGRLQSADNIRSAASRLLQDPRANARVSRFHGLWLGYHQLPHPAELTQALQTETSALVNKVIFEDQADYFELFRSNKTYINDSLADHYGLPRPGSSSFQWVNYGSSGRKGIMSQGSFLSAGAKFNDTSPTQRGIFIRTRLLCQQVLPPPPSVNPDQPPTSPISNCKVDRYAAHASVGSCAACHQNLDPVGFGLENYDRAGRFRATDEGHPECPISGNGRIAEMGAFNGPAALEDLLLASGQLEQCVVTQVYRFAMGKQESAGDAGLIAALTTKFQGSNRSFKQLLLDVASNETFAFRRAE